tara:strand:- start:57 stop:245 length:189 start_codon:yes stop_codon:yes gene_type:complete
MNKVDKPSEDKLAAIVATVQIPAEATDCQKLAALIAGLQKAYYELCDTCKPVEITPSIGPVE